MLRGDLAPVRARLKPVLRGAFIGFGNVAAKGHAPRWLTRGDVEIVAATDAAPSRRDAFRDAFPAGRWHERLDDLLSCERLDFVDVCAPPGAHAAVTKRALDAGLHVLCEKPLVTRFDDAHTVAAEAARARRVVHTVHNWLEAPICIKLSSLIAEGAVGAVRSVSWRTLRTEPAAVADANGVQNWRVDPQLAGGGILVDHGWHALYCVARWAGRPLAVSARLETRLGERPVEDTASLELRTASGRGLIFLTWAAEERSNLIEIEGERGRICAAGDIVTVESHSASRAYSCPPSLSAGSQHPDWFDGVADDFLAAAMGSGASNLGEAMMCAELIDLAQRSSAAGGVELSVRG